MKPLTAIKAAVNRLLPRASFARSVSLLVGGTATSQLLLMAAAPVLTRLYSPQAFGALAIYVAILALVAVVASFRYEMAVPLAENDQDAIYLVAICLTLVVFTSVAAAVLVACTGDMIASAVQAPEIAEHLWFLPIGVLCIGTYQIFNAFAIRKRAFATIARTRFKQAAMVLTLQIAGYKLGSLGLIAGQAIGQGAGSMSLGRCALSAMRSADRMSRSGVLNVMRKYRRFPIFSSWAAIFNALGAHLPAFLFAAMFGVQMAGFFALAYRVLTLPITVIGSAIGNVFLADAAHAHREGKLAAKMDTLHQKLAQFVMPFMLILALTGPMVFSFVFGQKWEDAGVFARWMTPWLYMVFVTSPLSSAFEAMGKQHHNLIFQATLLLVRVTSIIAGAHMDSIHLGLIGFSLGSALCWLLFLVRAFANVGLSFWRIVQPTALALLWGALCAAPLMIAVANDMSTYKFLACAGFSAILYVFNVYVTVMKQPAPWSP